MTSVRSKRAVRLAGAVLLSLAACAAPKPPPPVPSDALVEDEWGVLVSTHELARPPFMVVQRVTGKHGSEDVAFECAVQLSQGKLTIIGMTPYSPRAFVIEQDGVDVQFQKLMMRDVPFEPAQVLHDIHRVFFRGFPTAQLDGMHEIFDHGEIVRERWWRGQVVERRFHALETFSKLSAIRFEGVPSPVIAPRVRVSNVRYGYSLVIDNIEQKRLEEGYTLGLEQRPAP